MALTLLAWVVSAPFTRAQDIVPSAGLWELVSQTQMGEVKFKICSDGKVAPDALGTGSQAKEIAKSMKYKTDPPVKAGAEMKARTVCQIDASTRSVTDTVVRGDLKTAFEVVAVSRTEMAGREPIKIDMKTKANHLR
jgi:hypothetical protein